MRTLRIAGTKSYDILIGEGLIDACGQEIASLFRPARLALVTDDTVHDLYGKRAIKSLTAAGFDVRRHIVPSGDRAKSPAALMGILEFLGDNQFLKTDQLVWMGGSQLGSCAGVAASLYAQGMYTVQIPTTIGAAINISVGGDMLINLKAGRDLIGVNATPSLVLCDTDVLSALPEPLIRDGAARMLKYALIDHESLMAHLEKGDILDELGRNVEWCMRTKADLTRIDKFGVSARQIVELGNVVGNAVVACSKGKLSQGEGLAIGLLTTARAVPKMLKNKLGCAQRVEKVLNACSLPTICPYTCGELLNAIAATKRRNEVYFTIAVPCDVGDCEVKRVTIDELGKWLIAGGVSV